MTLREGTVNLHKLIDEAARLSSDTATEHGTELVQHVCTDLVSVHADKAKLCQVLVNLLDNALKFSERGSQVSISTSTNEAGGAVIEVADRGCGMSKDDIEVAFSRFGRVGPPSITHPGTGLGLPLSVELIRLHGGELHIDSELGKGTNIQITLPAERVVRLTGDNHRPCAHA